MIVMKLYYKLAYTKLSAYKTTLQKLQTNLINAVMYNGDHLRRGIGKQMLKILNLEEE